MMDYWRRMLKAMQPAFSRRAAFAWFVVVVVGLLLRYDTLGVSSLVRALGLVPSCYPALLHFFHSTAWQAETLLRCWGQWVLKEGPWVQVNQRLVLIGDHTQTPKDGRRMPEVTTLHQHSETASKPTFFRGHPWTCIAGLLETAHKSFAVPLWAELHRRDLGRSLATRPVELAANVAQALGHGAYLVLDAFFAVGPVFLLPHVTGGLLHILTRAKKNIVAYLPPPPKPPKRRGRPRRYGQKLKLADLFDSPTFPFQTAQARVYGRLENVRFLALDLLWKSVPHPLRFILLESSLGPLILISSDLCLHPLTALELYAHRVSIETLFDTLKNLLAGMRYHFWSKYLSPSSRRPTKNQTPQPASSDPQKTRDTLSTIERFLALHLVVLGFLQLLAARFPHAVLRHAHCWLRTSASVLPSEFVTLVALANLLRHNLFNFAKDWVTQLILDKRAKPRYVRRQHKAA